MRHAPALLTLLAVLGMSSPAAVAAEAGGTPGPGVEGGTEFGAPLKKSARKKARPVAREFALTPRVVRADGPRPRIRLRITDPGITKVHARLALIRLGSGRPALSMSLGRLAVGRRVVLRWPSRVPLPSGRFLARLHVKDGRGRTLLRRASTSGRTTLTVRAPKPRRGGIFPVAGPHDFGGAGARFGAQRPGHIHEGQDITAAEGTPVVAPLAGAVTWRAYQAGGAGYYLVVRGTDGRYYVFMHCQKGSIPVEAGATVRQGQQICAVGSTGRSSGPHLHFEIWIGGWRSDGGYPIDPLPDLKAWDSAGAAGAPQ
jgi:murein DD-endopeptidase MepM/ murein hydrolase activator NlpD